MNTKKSIYMLAAIAVLSLASNTYLLLQLKEENPQGIAGVSTESVNTLTELPRRSEASVVDVVSAKNSLATADAASPRIEFTEQQFQAMLDSSLGALASELRWELISMQEKIDYLFKHTEEQTLVEQARLAQQEIDQADALVRKSAARERMFEDMQKHAMLDIPEQQRAQARHHYWLEKNEQELVQLDEEMDRLQRLAQE